MTVRKTRLACGALAFLATLPASPARAAAEVTVTVTTHANYSACALVVRSSGMPVRVTLSTHGVEQQGSAAQPLVQSDTEEGDTGRANACIPGGFPAQNGAIDFAVSWWNGTATRSAFQIGAQPTGRFLVQCVTVQSDLTCTPTSLTLLDIDPA
jgi:hypothetical protein